MSFYEFATNSPWLTFFLGFLVCCLIELPFKLANRVIRHMNIRKAGWPPPYLDADGDRHEPETEPRP